MAEKIIYILNPGTDSISAHKVDIAELASFAGGGHDPNFSWRDDEARAFIEAKGIPAEPVEIPHSVYSRFGVRDPRISYTYSATGAARALGIGRSTFLLRLESHPLEAKGMHDNKPVYRWEDLVEWDKSIPAPGRPKNS